MTFYFSIGLFILTHILPISIGNISMPNSSDFFFTKSILAHRPYISSTSYKPDPLESVFLKKTNRKILYKNENIPIIELDTSVDLGKLSVFYFLKWVNNNPEGVVAIAANKISIILIKYLRYFKMHWDDPEIQEELKKVGFPSKKFPDTSKLKFVQLNEFFPINTELDNSLTKYLSKYIIKLLEIKEENFLSMKDSFVPILKKHGIKKIFPEGKINLNILSKPPKSRQEYLQTIAIKEVLNFCNKFDAKINKWGGIGLILSGIKLDGTIAYNQPGSLHSSPTRLVPISYHQKSTDYHKFGDTENIKNHYMITIGLKPLTLNKNADVIILTSDSMKAKTVDEVIKLTKPNINQPVSAFFSNPKLRFYITKKIGKKLTSRSSVDYLNKSLAEIPNSFIEQTIIDLSLEKKKPILTLTHKDFKSTPSSKLLYNLVGKDQIYKVCSQIQNNLIQKIEPPLNSANHRILHTSPHHEDIILSYYPVIKRLIKTTKNHFCIFTNGYQVVTNKYLKNQLNDVKKIVNNFESISSTPYKVFLDKFKETFRTTDIKRKKQIEAEIFAKKLMIKTNVDSQKEFQDKIDFFLSYVNKKYPNYGDPKLVQNLKGYIRESEEERMWYSCCGIPIKDIFHINTMLFSTNPYSTSYVSELDIKKLSNLIEEFNPQIITVALDYRESGPEVYYKSLKTLALSLKLLQKNRSPTIWAYHNIKDRLAVDKFFSFSEATHYYLIAKEEINEVDEIVHHCYSTQNENSFSSIYFDGALPYMMRENQKQTLNELKILLGENYFKYHPNLNIRNAAGIILIKEMSTREFLSNIKSIKTEIELDHENYDDL